MKKMRIKYFSFDKIPYLYNHIDDEFPLTEEFLLDPELKIAGWFLYFLFKTVFYLVIFYIEN